MNVPTVILTSASGASFDRPDDWNPNNNKIEIIGAGGSGGVGSPASGTVGSTTFYLAGGGSGAAYAFATNVDVEFPVALTWGFAGNAVLPTPYGGVATTFGTYVSAGAGMNGYPNGSQTVGGSGTGAGDVNGPNAMPAQNLATWPNGLYGGMGGAGVTTVTDPTGYYGAGGGGAAGPNGAGGNGQDVGGAGFGGGGTANGNTPAGGSAVNSDGNTALWGSGYGSGRGGGGASAVGALPNSRGGNGGNYGGGGAVGSWAFPGNTRTPRDAGIGGASLIVVTWTPAPPAAPMVTIMA